MLVLMGKIRVFYDGSKNFNSTFFIFKFHCYCYGRMYPIHCTLSKHSAIQPISMYSHGCERKEIGRVRNAMKIIRN